MTVNRKGQVAIPESFERIMRRDLRTGDILLFIGGTWITEWHGKNRRKEFGRSDTPPYHAAIVYDFDTDGRVFILDQELKGTFSLLDEYTSKKNLRIDIVRPEATPEQLKRVKEKILALGIQEKLYDSKGFLYFIKQMPYLGWIPMPKPSTKLYYCSDAVAEVWQESGIEVSPRDNNFTAPVDLQLYGLEHHEMRTVKLTGEVM